MHSISILWNYGHNTVRLAQLTTLCSWSQVHLTYVQHVVIHPPEVQSVTQAKHVTRCQWVEYGIGWWDWVMGMGDKMGDEMGGESGDSVTITNNPALYVPYWLSHTLLPTHPTLSPDSSSSCHTSVMCYTCQSHMMCTTMSSAWLVANLLSNRSHIVRRALPTIVITWFGVLCESTICPLNFMMHYIFV